jgi:hypothetical protein
MTISVVPSQDDIQTVLVSFLGSILPIGTEIFEGLDNRVPEPAVTNFVVFSPVQRIRLATNIDSYADTVFTGSITGNILTVASISQGALALGSTVFGTGVQPSTTVAGFGPGVSGGAGVYTVSPPQNTPSQPMAAGTFTLQQNTEVIFQLDVHSSVVGVAADMAQAITTAFRDPYAVDLFSGINPLVSPLYADDPKMIAFVSGEEQYESRWVVEVRVQANQQLTGFPQQFADVLNINLQVLP